MWGTASRSPTTTTRAPRCRSDRRATLRRCLAEPTERRLCADGQWPVVVGDMVVQRDTGHLTTVYARHLAEPLARALRVDRP